MNHKKNTSFDLIIDSGNCKNIISEYNANKL